MDGEGDEGAASNVESGLASFFGVASLCGVVVHQPLGLGQPLLRPPGVPGLCQCRRGAGDRGAGEVAPGFEQDTAFFAPESSNAATRLGKPVVRKYCSTCSKD